MKHFPLNFLSGKEKDMLSLSKCNWMSLTSLVDNLCVNFPLLSVFFVTNVYWWNFVQGILASLEACLKLWYFFTLCTAADSLLWFFLTLFLPISINMAPRHSLHVFQYLFIRTCFAGILYSWSHTCFKIAIAVVGLSVSNLQTATDCQWTNDVYTSEYFFWMGYALEHPCVWTLFLAS